MESKTPLSKNNTKTIFKCDDQVAIISSKLLSFYQENELFDTVLVAGQNCVSIHAHRVVLCALSEYFLEILRGRQTSSETNVVELKDIEASTLKLIIDFMYSGWIELCPKTVEGILRIASFLKINTLIDGCCEFIEKNINPMNSLKFFRFANELNIPRLKVNTLECIYNNFEVISKEKELMMLNENELKSLLFNDNPHGDIEKDVFLSMVAWVNYDKLNREHLSFQLLSMVRFQALTPKFIVESRKKVCKTVESYELICKWLQWHLSPETRSEDQQNFAFKPRKTSDKLSVIRAFDEDKINIETFDPESNSWSIILETSLPIKNLYSSIIKIDNKLLVVGGIRDNGKSIECLDLHSCEWTNLPAMNKSHSNSQLADLKGYLCVFSDDNDWSKSMEIYNFSTRKWHDVEMPSKPSEASRIAAYNGLLYILDFENGLLQSYNVSANKWTSKVVEESSLHCFAFVANESFLYVIGGYYYENEECEPTVKRFNLSNNSWCELASIPHIEYSILAATIFKNKIIVGDENSNIVYEYNIDTNKWDALCSPSSKIFLRTNTSIFCTYGQIPKRKFAKQNTCKAYVKRKLKC